MKFGARKIVVLVVITLLVSLSFCFISGVSSQYYPISQNQLTVSVNYNGAGYVYPGTGSYYYGSTVIQRVYTNPGYVFDGWYLDGVYMGKLTTIP